MVVSTDIDLRQEKIKTGKNLDILTSRMKYMIREEALIGYELVSHTITYLLEDYFMLSMIFRRKVD